ncbi:hypothetical protein ACTXT7_016344 [Hymenolepis weldensis]
MERRRKISFQPGGRITSHQISKPLDNHWKNVIDCLRTAHDFEKEINEYLIILNLTALNNKDAHLKSFLKPVILDTCRTN